MFSAIYIENEVKHYKRVELMLSRYPDVPHIFCERYGEIFNRNSQNFRLQKKSPALILARKHGNLVLPAPKGYGFDNGPGFYFSHMFNCVYDCRYCFLQGMYRSANYVVFVNYEEFESALHANITKYPGPSVYYSGYDCDSLALEPVSKFCKYFLPFFSKHPEVVMEIRTKSTQVRTLLESTPLKNCIVAMSFTAHDEARKWEHRVPSIAKRIDTLKKLQQAGWPVAIRFEPLIYEPNMLQRYLSLFEQVFSALDSSAIHSVSTGEFRMPAEYMKNIIKLYPDEPLFARPMHKKNGVMSLFDKNNSYHEAIEKLLLRFISAEQYYRCV